MEENSMKTFAGVLLCLALVTLAQAGVPQLMNYQGRLLTDGGDPVDTTISIVFTIYDDSTGGVPLWTETHPAVYVADGLFTVLLGSNNPLTEGVFADDQRYLGIAVGTDPEIEPRTQFSTVGYSYRVSTIDGATAGALTGDFTLVGMTRGDSEQEKLHSGTPKLELETNMLFYAAGRTGSMHLLDGAGNIAIDLDGPDSSLGIATSNMAANLHVNGSIYTLGGSGDANLDGSLTIGDVTAIIDYLGIGALMADANFAEADVDGDGRVTYDDAAIIIKMLFAGDTKAQAWQKIHSVYGVSATQTAEYFYVSKPTGIGTSNPSEMLQVFWQTNVDAELGRGVSDPDITYLALRNANGTKCYIYPNAAGNGIVVSITKP
jgi:hypothetical protein